MDMGKTEENFLMHKMRKMKYMLEENKEYVCIILIIYRILLEVIYIYGISPISRERDYTNNIEPLRYIVSWVIFFVFIPYFVRKIDCNKFTDMCLMILFLLAYVPGTILIGRKESSWIYIILYFGYEVCLVIFHFLAGYIKIPYFGIIKKYNDIVLYLICAICTVVVIYISWKYTGMRLHLGLWDVDKLRAENGNIEVPSLILYLYSMSGQILSVCTVALLCKKRVVSAMLLVFVQWFNFSIDGSKSIIMSEMIAIGIYILYRFIKVRGAWIISAFNLIVIATLLERIICPKQLFFRSMIIKRMFFEPQMINYFYYDFFLYNEKDLFRQSIIRHIGIKSPYTDEIPKIIGKIYFPTPTSANNGLFSDAYYNLGIPGIIIMPILLVALLVIIEAYSKNCRMEVRAVAAILICIHLISSSFFTTLLSHGVMGIFLLLWILNEGELKTL